MLTDLLLCHKIWHSGVSTCLSFWQLIWESIRPPPSPCPLISLKAKGARRGHCHSGGNSQYAALEEPACILRQSCWQSLNEQIDLSWRRAALRCETSSISGQNCFIWHVACKIYSITFRRMSSRTVSKVDTCAITAHVDTWKCAVKA